MNAIKDNEQKPTKKNLKNKIKDFVNKYPTFAEFVRFLIVGGFTTLIDMFVMGVVLYLFQPEIYPSFFNVFIGGGTPSSVSAIVGTACGFISGLIVSFFCSVFFVFIEKTNAKNLVGFAIFAIISAGGLLIHIVGMWLGNDILGINEWLVKIFFVVVVLIYNYFTKKKFLFSKKHELGDIKQ